jgi:hypothetical protein
MICRSTRGKSSTAAYSLARCWSPNFVLRAKHKLNFRRRQSHPVDRATGVRSDQTIILAGKFTARKYPALLRRVSFYAADIDQRFVFLTNNFQIPSPIISAIYH